MRGGVVVVLLCRLFVVAVIAAETSVIFIYPKIKDSPKILMLSCYSFLSVSVCTDAIRVLKYLFVDRLIQI